MAERPQHRGRVTPKASSASNAAGKPAPERSSRRRAADEPGQVGRRPSSPALLLVVGAMWIVCGIVALIGLHAGWKLIPGVVFIGVGLFFVRGAAATTVRRSGG